MRSAISIGQSAGGSRLLLSACLAITAVGAQLQTTRAGLVVADQVFTPSPNLGALVGEGYPYVGQTVTPGVSGNLAEVDIMMGRFASYLGDFTLNIQATNVAGAPTADVITSLVLSADDVPTTGVVNGFIA